MGATLWRGGKEIGVEPQAADEGCSTADGVRQFMDGKAAIAHENDVALWYPATDLERPLARPVGQQLVSATALMVGALRRSQQAEHREGLHNAGPGDRRQHHEAQPAQPTGFDEVAMAGADGVAIDAAHGDPAAPSALDCIVHPDDHGTFRHEAVDDHGQQAPRQRAGLPAGAVEELVVA